jgi:hypothetical protein
MAARGDLEALEIHRFREHVLAQIVVDEFREVFDEVVQAEHLRGVVWVE